jgi:choline-sulfatase
MHTRREFLRRSVAAAGVLAVPSLLARAAMATADGGSAKPNVLFIMTDQQFADAMSCRMGTEYIRTPVMDSLAGNGTLFSRAYSPNPLCMPARGSIFTGRYPHETGVTRNAVHKVDPKDFVCMGTYFRQAGYETAYFGKWHLFMSTKDTVAHGFETFGDARPGGERDEATMLGALKFISGRHDKPFLAVASFLNPHNICQFSRGQELPCGPIGEPPAPEKCPPPPANLAAPRDETDTMATMRKGYHASALFPVGGFSSDKWRQYRWGYYRMIEKVDAQIGAVLDALKKAGLEENTVVIFTADHGECAGAHGFNQKTVFYEESARVPLIVCGKGVAKKAVRDHLVNTGVDILPTMLAFAGIAKPDKLTGLSLRPLTMSELGIMWRTYVVVENDMAQAGTFDGLHPSSQGRMVRTDRYKYCIYDHGIRREALFDMRADPMETANLAGDPAHRQTVLDHRKILADFASRHNDETAKAMLADDVPPRPFEPGTPVAPKEAGAGKPRGKVKAGK